MPDRPISRPRILCISLSPIVSDGRVLRQISVLAEFGDVTTIGFGPTPPGATEHIEIPDGLTTLPQTPIGVAALLLRRFGFAQLAAPAVRRAYRELAGRPFDLVVANEARVLGLAHAVAAGAPVWADMHEWAPEERTHILSWRLLVAPFMTWLCARYLPASALVTTVCDSIAELYRERFSVTVGLMRNSGPFRDLTPQPVSEHGFRLVHSGAAVKGRNIETIIDVVSALDERYTLDLYLVSGGDGRYLGGLKERAAPCDRIRFHDPVPPDELPATLNQYDIGVHWIPPANTNAKYALPNKFFDYVQARLAIAVGPSVEMAELVTRLDLGVVAEGFTAAECRNSLEGLSRDAVVACKQASGDAAHELSFEADAARARGWLTPLLGG